MDKEDMTTGTGHLEKETETSALATPCVVSQQATCACSVLPSSEQLSFLLLCTLTSPAISLPADSLSQGKGLFEK